MRAWMIIGGSMALAGAVQGDVLIEVSSGTDTGGTALVQEAVAAGFELPASDLPWTLDQVDLLLADAFGEDAPAPRIRLLSNAVVGGLDYPDADITTLLRTPAEDAGDLGGIDDFESYLPADTVELLPETTYWIVVESEADGFSWLGEFGPTVNGPAEQSSPAYRSADVDAPRGWVTAFETTTPAFAVYGTPVPEPATLALAAIGAAALVGRPCRRARASMHP